VCGATKTRQPGLDQRFARLAQIVAFRSAKGSFCGAKPTIRFAVGKATIGQCVIKPRQPFEAAFFPETIRLETVTYEPVSSFPTLSQLQADGNFDVMIRLLSNSPMGELAKESSDRDSLGEVVHFGISDGAMGAPEFSEWSSMIGILANPNTQPCADF
jgi:hypothetical protein